LVAWTCSSLAHFGRNANCPAESDDRESTVGYHAADHALRYLPVFGHLLEEIPAGGRLLASRLKEVAPAAIGISRGRWNNVRALLRAALNLVKPISPGRHRNDLLPEWTLADLLAFLTTVNLPERKRQELASAIRTAARAFGRSLVFSRSRRRLIHDRDR
jgi:hypothetical protein